MIATESELAKKRCTPALVLLVAKAVGGTEQFNAATISESVPLSMNCIGSRCAQWCWYDYVDAGGLTHFPNEAQCDHFAKGRREHYRDVTSASGFRPGVPGRGFCGFTVGRE